MGPAGVAGQPRIATSAGVLGARLRHASAGRALRLRVRLMTLVCKPAGHAGQLPRTCAIGARLSVEESGVEVFGGGSSPARRALLAYAAVSAGGPLRATACTVPAGTSIDVVEAREEGTRSRQPPASATRVQLQASANVLQAAQGTQCAAKRLLRAARKPPNAEPAAPKRLSCDLLTASKWGQRKP